MTITKEMLSPIKRSNVSRDYDKTKLRVKEDFLAIRNKQKTAIIELCGLKRTSVYRVFREGAISARIVLAMSQILNVSPFYYTGESDEKDECSDALLLSFLEKKGLRDLANKLTAGRNDAPVKEVQPEVPVIPKKPVTESAGTGALFTTDFSNSPRLEKAAAELSLEDAYKLMEALFIRAKAGGNAEQIADLVKRCLLM